MNARRTCRSTLLALVALATLTSTVLAATGATRTGRTTAIDHTWTSSYDWSSAAPTGFGGWTAAAPDGYAAAQTFAGRAGLWLWPTGARDYAAGDGAEWTLDAPGTTAVLSASLVVSYSPQVFDHHCLSVAVTGNAPATYCEPPTGGRDPSVQVDLTGTPGRSVTVRLEVPAGSGRKTIPSNDPAKGLFVRVDRVRLVLSDDEVPSIAASGPLWDVGGRFTDGSKTFAVGLAASDPGSGVTGISFSTAGAETASATAVCDTEHRNADSSSRVCPASLPLATSVDLATRPEGETAFTAATTDLSGRSASLAWSTFVDRTPPNAPVATGPLYDARDVFVNGSRSYDVALSALDPGQEQKKASGIARLALESGGRELVGAGVPGCTEASCPVSASVGLAVDASRLDEGANTFVPRATDFVGHATDGGSWTVGVDRRAPAATPGGALRALADGFTAGDSAIAWSADAADPEPVPMSGSGVRAIHLLVDRAEAGGEVVCDARMCPRAGSTAGSFDAPALTEGRHTIAVSAADAVGNAGTSASWTVSADRSSPLAPDALELNDLDLVLGTASIGWPQIVDATLADGSPGSGVADVQARWRSGGDWSSWRSLGASGHDLAVVGVTAGGVLEVQVRATDRVGHVSAVGGDSFELPATTELESTSCVNELAFGEDTPTTDGAAALSLSGDSGTVSVPSDASSGVALATAEGQTVTVGLPSADDAGDAVRIADGAVHYDGGAGGADTVVAVLGEGQDNPCLPVPDEGAPFLDPIDVTSPGVGVDVLTVIDGESSPTEYDFPVGVPAGGSIRANGGGFEILDAGGTPIVGVDPPAALDDHGDVVATTATLQGTTLHVHVDHPGHAYAYPVVLDPQYRIDTGETATFTAAAQEPTTNAVTFGKPGKGGYVIVCTAYGGSALLGRGSNLRMRYGGKFDARNDCTGIGGARVTLMYIHVCLQKQQPDGTWPSGQGDGPCVGQVGVNPITPKIEKFEETPCERYAYYRLWMSAGGAVRDPDGKTIPMFPAIGVLKGSTKRCLPVPNVNWGHIFAPDLTLFAEPSGWHWRSCFLGNCVNPPGIVMDEANDCLSDPNGTGVYGCVWKHSGYPGMKEKYSTFFPRGWTQAEVQNAVLQSYMSAKFKGNQWFGRPIKGAGFSITGKLVNGDLDTVGTAYPNRYLNPRNRTVQILLETGDDGGDDGGGGGDDGGGAPADVFVTVTTAFGGVPHHTWVWWDGEEDGTGQGGIQFCRVGFSTGQAGFDLGPAGGPQYWDTLPGFMTVTCWGLQGAVGSDTGETY